MNKLLFSPLKIRDITFRNRIFVSPMCQYSSVDGVAQPWHMVHLGSRAVGGAALVIVEATGVSPEGRISPFDSGLWNEKQAEAFAPITKFIKEQGAVAGIQLAHAGRKASTSAPWDNGGKPLLQDNPHHWTTLAPSAIPFDKDFPTPNEMTLSDLQKVKNDFCESARLSLKAGFEVVEIHMAHGYLLHEFLSPLSNQRKDNYGGPLENRLRAPLEIAQAVREVWPKNLPLFVRISATDWTAGGWDLEQSTALAHGLKKLGVDLIDCSSGGNVPHAKIPLEPGYQVPFAEAIKRDVKILTGAVGLITDAKQAEQILVDQKADVVLLARQMLRDPYFPLHAAKELGVEIKGPKQYGRA